MVVQQGRWLWLCVIGLSAPPANNRHGFSNLWLFRYAKMPGFFT